MISLRICRQEYGRTIAVLCSLEITSEIEEYWSCTIKCPYYRQIALPLYLDLKTHQVDIIQEIFYKNFRKGGNLIPQLGQ